MSVEAMNLCLADGTVFGGVAYGAKGTAIGELALTGAGYGEALTDPSNFGQLVALTNPLAGNVGMVAEDAESVSGAPSAFGLVFRDASPMASNFCATESLDRYLERHGVVAIAGVDTRALAKHLREHGAQVAAIGSEPAELLVRKAREHAKASDLVQKVTAKEPFTWAEGSGAWRHGEAKPLDRHVVVLDLGVKRSQLRALCDAGCRVTAVPATTSATDLLALSPQGIFLSSGPGNPASLGYVVETVRALVGKAPIFGVGLGHQVLALALGGKTYELARPRRASNQPVLELATGKVEITSHNHAFAVEEASLAGRAKVTHVHLNDRTVYGLEAAELRAFSVQHQPESGAHDSLHLFDRFARLIDEAKGAR